MHGDALESLRIHGAPLIREQGVGSSNLPAPANKINNLGILKSAGAPETAPDTQVFAAAKMSTTSFDAWRVQLHNRQSARRHLQHERLRSDPQLHAFAARLSHLAAHTALIDGESVSSDALPNFGARPRVAAAQANGGECAPEAMAG